MKVMKWITQNNMLVKEFTFTNFKEALQFVNEVGQAAEDINHHPDILIHSYKKVKILLYTHSEGRITDRDHTLASIIDEL